MRNVWLCCSHPPKSIMWCNTRFGSRTVYPWSRMEKTAILGTVIRDTGDQFDDKHVLQQFPSGLSLLGTAEVSEKKTYDPSHPSISTTRPKLHCCITSYGAKGPGKPDQSLNHFLTHINWYLFFFLMANTWA